MGSNFHHVKFSLKAVDEEESNSADPKARLKKVNHETRDTLAELERTYVKKDVEETVIPKPDKFNAATFSTGMSAASLTSTAFERVTELQAARLDDEVVLFSRVKKKGYVRINTNLGPLNLELYCDVVPKTCQNFIIVRMVTTTTPYFTVPSDILWCKVEILRGPAKEETVFGAKHLRMSLSHSIVTREEGC